MDNITISNVSILESIVNESYESMTELLKNGRTPKEGGGYVVKYDANHQSFKEALKVIVFVGATLEAMWHQRAVELKSKNFADKKDRECKSVAEKLEILGINDELLLERVKSYYSARREIVHEKAHSSAYKKNVHVAQHVAEEAVKMLANVKLQLMSLNG